MCCVLGLGLAYLLCENWYSRSSIWQICCILNTLKYNKSYFFCLVCCSLLFGSLSTFILTNTSNLSLWLLAWYIYARKIQQQKSRCDKSDMKPGLSYTIARVVKIVKHYFLYPRKIVETDIVSNVLLFIIAEYK